MEREQETDGRWICEVASLPGVVVYGATREEALAQVQALALRILADRWEPRDESAGFSGVSFEVA